MTRAPEPTAAERKTEEPVLPAGWELVDSYGGYFFHRGSMLWLDPKKVAKMPDEEVSRLVGRYAAELPHLTEIYYAMVARARLALYRWEQERRAKLARDGGTT